MSLARRKLGITLLLVWTATATVIRAVRYPNDYAEAHWLLDYRLGFVKRGLIGTLVSWAARLVHRPVTEELVLTLSVASFLVFSIVLIVVSLRIIHRSGWSATAVLVALTFLSSPFIVISAHLVGYYDNVIVVLAVLSIFLVLKGRIWLAACCQAVAIFTHEISLLIGFPLLLLAALLVHSKNRQGFSGFPFLPLSLPVAAFVVVAAGQVWFVPPDFREVLTEHFSRFDFIGEERHVMAPFLLTSTFWQFFTAQKVFLASRLTWIVGYGLVLPSTMALLCHVVDGHRIREISVESFALLGVCCAPQLMHLVAWDTPRILTYTILCSFLALWIYSELFVAHDGSSGLRLLCLAVLVVNVVALTPVTDERPEHFALATRLLLFAPVMVAIVALILHEDRGRLAERLTIQRRLPEPESHPASPGTRVASASPAPARAAPADAARDDDP